MKVKQVESIAKIGNCWGYNPIERPQRGFFSIKFLFCTLILNNRFFPDNHLNMNRENFAEFLKNPEKLFHVTYEELKTLSLQYPFSANLHLLLWQKSRQEGHSEEDKNLAKAAAYTFDRPHLFRLFHSGEPLIREDFVTEMEEFLELKELALLEAEPLAPRTEQQAPFRESDIAESPAANMTVDEHQPEGEEPALPNLRPAEEMEVPDSGSAGLQTDIPAAALSPEQVETEEFREPEIVLTPLPMDIILSSADMIADGIWAVERWRIEQVDQPQNWTETGDIPLDIIPGNSNPEEAAGYPSGKREIIFEIANQETIQPTELPPAPLAKNRFSSWQRQSSVKPAFVIPDNSSLGPASNPEPGFSPALEKAPEDNVRRLAEQSLAENEGLISETLANLLAHQGQNDKAIKMFERLMVKNPEKSAFFAAKIEELKKY